MKLLVGILSILWSVSISGEESYNYDFEDAPVVISRMLEEHLIGLESNLSEKSNTEPKIFEESKTSNIRFYLQRFLFRIQPFVSFDVGVANLKLSPFFEIRVKRSPPKGWQPYQP